MGKSLFSRHTPNLFYLGYSRQEVIANGTEDPMSEDDSVWSGASATCWRPHRLRTELRRCVSLVAAAVLAGCVDRVWSPRSGVFLTLAQPETLPMLIDAVGSVEDD